MLFSHTLLAAAFAFAATAATAQTVASVERAYAPSAERVAVKKAPAKATAAPMAATRLMPAYDGGTDALVEAIASRLEYPAIAQANGVEGTVVLRVRIDERGRATVSQVIEGLSTECDAAAVAAVEALEGFTPARLNGRAFARNVCVAVNFSL